VPPLTCIRKEKHKLLADSTRIKSYLAQATLKQMGPNEKVEWDALIAKYRSGEVSLMIYLATSASFHCDNVLLSKPFF